ncbi:hypothetical protein [Peribacillus glennii]|uniref:hypothetical protein n=1 Tax=Peribacillus glennii TaxID=2303991 RepID=UPI001F34CFBB|nr:hypothetical protein [Peribacillus glennii]
MMETQINLGGKEWKKYFSSDIEGGNNSKTSLSWGYCVFGRITGNKAVTLFHSPIKLPLILHIFLIRIAWLFNHKSQSQTTWPH